MNTKNKYYEKDLIVILCFTSLALKAQKLDSLIALSSESLPDKSIVEKYPLLFATIKQLQVEEPNFKKVYYGRLNSNYAIKTFSFKRGIILFDIDYLERNTKDFENTAIWLLLIDVGAINFGYGVEEPVLFDLAKSKYIYALNKAKSIDEKNNSNVLKTVITSISGTANGNKDMNLKMAAEEVRNSEIFKNYKSNLPLNPVIPSTTVPAIDQERVKKALKNLFEDKDEFTGKIYYFDRRVDSHHVTGDGLFAKINKEDNFIKFIIYHQGLAALINQIMIKSGDDIKPFKCDKMHGNGTTFSYLTISGTTNDQTSYPYKILKSIVTSGICMIRFDTQFGRIDDYTLSKREIKEIATVVEAYEAINGL